MATASPTQTRGSTRAVQQGAAPAVQVEAVSRREFLYYIWGASIVLLLGQATAGLIWFALPRFKEGEFGGVFPFDPGEVPLPGTAPISVPSGRFHVSNNESGLVALYGVCTHLGCLPKWDDSNARFACPCHGSQFARDGGYITGPAPRGLDRFVLTVRFADGTTLDNGADGKPIPVAGREIESVAIDTGSRVLGPGIGAENDSTEA